MAPLMDSIDGSMDGAGASGGNRHHIFQREQLEGRLNTAKGVHVAT